jgi:hypothetical protein
MMRAVAAIVIVICSTWLFSQPAIADKRVALVIGNSAYQKVNPLTNPVNDSGAISGTFKNAGFDVVELKRDLNVSELRRALRDFSDTVRDADVAIVYYAGHGIEIDGTNYLIPVDAVLERDIDAYDEAVPLDRILTVIEPAKQLRLVILDACRDNPFNKTMKRTIGARAIGRGLAKVEPGSPNTLIAFAAKAGSTASDGDSKNSPFTAALVKYLPRPGLDLRKAFGFARDDVLKATNNRQEPFIYGSLGGDDLALVPAVVAPPPAAAPPSATSVADPNAAIRRDYELSEKVGTREAWDFFLSAYPEGFYAKLAQAQRNKFAAEEARVAATEKARVAAVEQERLVAEGAKTSELAKAAEQAKATEQARVAAEKKKKAEDAKVAEAERAKAAAQAKAAEDARIAAEKAKKIEEAKAEQERAAAEKKKAQDDAKASEAERAKAAVAAKADEATKLAADKPAEKPVGPLAALAPDRSPEAEIKTDQSVATDIPRLLQSELRRVGCNTGSVDGNWNTASQKSLTLFNKYAGMKLDVKVASLDALDAIKSKPARICPLVCEHGFKADGERCVAITCGAGSVLNDDNECEKKRDKPAVTREQPRKREEAERPRTEAQAAPKVVQPSGQIFCGNSGCRAVRPGCHLGHPGNGSAANVEVCN